MIACRERHEADDESGRQGGAPRDRAQQAQDPIRVDGGSEHGERGNDYPNSEREDPAFGERLGADVDRAENGKLGPTDENGVAALGGDRIRHDHENSEHGRKPQGNGQCPTGSGEEPRDRDRRGIGREYRRMGEGEGDRDESPQIRTRRQSPRPAERSPARYVGERSDHGASSTAGKATGASSAMATA